MLDQKIKTLIAIILFPLFLFAQTPSDSLRGFWKKNIVSNYIYEFFNPTSKEFERPHLSEGEFRDIKNHIQRITNFFKEIKALNPPMGAAVYFYGQGGEWLELSSRTSPKPFIISLLDRKLFKDCDTCKIFLADHADLLLTITVNDLTSLFRIAPYKNDINKDPIPLYSRWFIAPTLAEIFLGQKAEITEEADFVVLTKINKPIGIPVTQEEFLTEAIRAAKKDFQETEKLFSVSTYQSGKKELDDAEREMRKAVREMEKIDPSAARKMQQEFEKQKQAALENLKSSENDIDKQKQEGLRNSKFILNSLENELASLSNEERRSPALYKFWGYTEDDSTGQKIFTLNKDRSERLSGLVDNGGFPVVRINPNYFNNSVSKTDIQLIVIKIARQYRHLKPNEFLSKLVDKICENLDLAPLFQMVR